MSTVTQNVAEVHDTRTPSKRLFGSSPATEVHVDPFQRTERPPPEVTMQNDALVHATSYVEEPVGWILVDVHPLPFHRAAHPTELMS